MTFEMTREIIGVALILCVWFLRKKKKIALLFLGAVFIVLLGPIFLPGFFWGKWDAIKELKGQRISTIIISPTQEQTKNLTDLNIIIKNQKTIDSLIHLLRNTEVYFPNHPSFIWKADLTIINQNDSIKIKVEKSENGTIISSSKEKFRKDELSNYLEKIVNYSKN